MQQSDRQYLQVCKQGKNDIIYYDLKTETFYRYYNDSQNSKYGYYLNIIGIPIILGVGRLIQPYWREQILYIPVLRFTGILFGVVCVTISFIKGKDYLNKKIERESGLIFLLPSKKEMVEKGVSQLKHGQKIVAPFWIVMIGVGAISYYANNFLISFLFWLSCFCVGILGAALQPRKRKKMYREFKKKLKEEGEESK